MRNARRVFENVDGQKLTVTIDTVSQRIQFRRPHSRQVSWLTITEAFRLAERARTGSLLLQTDTIQTHTTSPA